ncbi:MAG TPA: hypothetical protein VEX18_17885 [Polyangiaceae bacterium]|nr:hypothetical protein [Polyangiaceae bacterium]
MPSPKLTSRRLALLSGFALLGVLGAVSVCNAESPWRRRGAPPAPTPHRLWRLSLEDQDGAALPTFRQAGQRFVLGEPGARYNVRVENPTAERVEVVVTIDGRDAISGKVGDYVTQRGYLVEPWGSLVVEGFRRSLDEVAAFRFTDRSQSYSALRGTPENVGVIGVAVFPEKSRPPAPVRPRPRPYSYDERYDDSDYEYRRDTHGSGREKSADAAPPSPAKAPTAERAPNSGRHDFRTEQEAPRKRKGEGPSNIGTQYGEREDSSVVEVAFERRSKTHPSAVLTLRYDDYNGLAARGIDLSSLGYAYRKPHSGEPEPFPYSRFAPPPSRY